MQNLFATPAKRIQGAIKSRQLTFDEVDTILYSTIEISVNFGKSDLNLTLGRIWDSLTLPYNGLLIGVLNVVIMW